MLQTIDDVEEFFQSRESLGIKPGLDRVLFLLEQVNHPERKLQAVHVAGTNGKGSTIQFMSQALQKNNYCVGVFTSPSFIGLGGHFIINDIPAQDTNIMELINELLPYIKIMDTNNNAPTSFEIITVMAFLYFAERVDIAIIETGMGGRFDTTNCFMPILTVITTISMDHMTFLGNSLTQIAWQKAGIIKKHVPVILGNINDKDCVKQFQQISEQEHAKLYRFGEAYQIKNSQDGFFYWQQKDHAKIRLSVQMEGRHQLENAAVAWMALMLLQEQGYQLSIEKTQQGIYEAILPGRFEKVWTSPILLLDSAHNAAGIEAFLATLDQQFPLCKKVVLFAGFKDKQLMEMIQQLKDNIDELIITTFAHPRAADLAYFDILSGTSMLKKETDWKNAIDQMIIEKESQTVYAVTGSLHFITKVRQYIKAEK